MSLTYIAQQLTIYVGSVLLFLGVVGNTINIFIFSSERTYRQTPCTFYFLIGCIHNILYILINLTIRIVSTVYTLDLTRTSLIWCKANGFFIAYLGLTSFTCSCLATIDQFFATSRNAYLRRLSNIRLAHLLVCITIIIWLLHGIPVLVFYDTPPVTIRCMSANPTYGSYISVYILLFQCGIPICIMIVFGYLTYRNIRLARFLAEQRADRQLIKMISIQMVLVIISMVPFGCFTIYNLITMKTKKNKDRQLKESFAYTIFVLVSYLYYVGNFYMFFISSSRFRRTVKNRFLRRQRRDQTVTSDQPTL